MYDNDGDEYDIFDNGEEESHVRLVVYWIV